MKKDLTSYFEKNKTVFDYLESRVTTASVHHAVASDGKVTASQALVLARARAVAIATITLLLDLAHAVHEPFRNFMKCLYYLDICFYSDPVYTVYLTGTVCQING